MSKDRFYIINKTTDEVLCLKVKGVWEKDATILNKCFKAPISRMNREVPVVVKKYTASYYQNEANELIYPGWAMVNTKEWTP